MAPTPIPRPPVLAPPGWQGNQLPYYGWKAIRTLGQIISSAGGSQFSRIPDPIMGIVWYSVPLFKDLFYGDVTAVFRIPDGTTRQRSPMDAAAYAALVDKITTDPELDVWPF